ncbi:SEC-C domain-containing protein, partial [bacterium]|nr:SEC-C domain-containing protein [bacterium]
KGLPDGEYGFLESYCDEKACDCRRVIINVVEAERPDKVLATINYGWESAKFYGKWGKSPGLAKETKGPFLDPLNRQTRFAPALLRLFEEHILPDTAYIKRLKRHYEMFKQAVAAAAAAAAMPARNQNRLAGRRLGRNEPCSCGSGRKYKHCCEQKERAGIYF